MAWISFVADWRQDQTADMTQPAFRMWPVHEELDQVLGVSPSAARRLIHLFGSTILNIFVPHSPQDRLVAERPLFIVTAFALVIGRWVLHFMQCPRSTP